MDLITTQLENKVGTITLSHCPRHNCISAQLVAELIAAFDEMERADAYVVLLRALPGVTVWSAGHDIGELPDGRRDPLGYQDALEQLLRRVQDFPSPVIAMVEGSVWGGACDICISCDMIVCSDDATFAITPAKLGLPYNASGLVHFLHVLGPQLAKEMFFTAQPITASRALQVGMVNQVVARDELESATYALANTIIQNAPLAVRVLKKQFRLLLRGQMLSSETFENIQGMRREVYDSQDYLEGIRAFKDRRPPVFTGR